MPFPVIDKFVKETEEIIGARFPDAYRQRMIVNNGGEIYALDDIWTLNPIFDTTDKKHLKRTCNDVVRETEYAKKWSDFPRNGISIAQNGSGDHLVFIIIEDKIESNVYFWFHETGELTVISPDFSFLAN